MMGSLTTRPLKMLRGGGVLTLPSLSPMADLQKHKAWLNYLAKAKPTQGISKKTGSTNRGGVACSMFKVLLSRLIYDIHESHDYFCGSALKQGGRYRQVKIGCEVRQNLPEVPYKCRVAFLRPARYLCHEPITLMTRSAAPPPFSP